MSALRTFADPWIASEVDRTLALFQSAGAKLVEVPTLLAADRMLDLYGEDIRERAYIVHDPIEGDYVLRPDFTLPLVEAHMRSGANPARFAYSGRVWRKRRETARTDRSYWQLGYEVFDQGDQTDCDVEVLDLAVRLAAPLDLTLRLGDLGLIQSVLHRLEISDFRREALLRQIWRPRAFDALLDRFCELQTPRDTSFPGDVAVIGLRRREMIEKRLAAIDADAAQPPITKAERNLIDTVIGLAGSLASAENAIATMDPVLYDLAARFALRNEKLAARGIDPSAIKFDASYGRESMEYYDGLVFGFYGQEAAPVITGGRYNGLTTIMGNGKTVPAIGLAYRPGLSGGGL